MVGKHIKQASGLGIRDGREQVRHGQLQDLGSPDWNSDLPSFGITQTYRMYDTEGSRNAALTYNLSPDAGYYTHYVDSTHGSATNTDNPYGSPSVPRLSPPPDLPVGSTC